MIQELAAAAAIYPPSKPGTLAEVRLLEQRIADEGMTRELYVQLQLLITRDQMERGMLRDYIDPRPGPTFGENRMQRCERYALWRWREYHTLDDGTRLPDGTFEAVLDRQRRVTSL